VISPSINPPECFECMIDVTKPNKATTFCYMDTKGRYYSYTIKIVNNKVVITSQYVSSTSEQKKWNIMR
jgi:hypothetical protein